MTDDNGSAGPPANGWESEGGETVEHYAGMSRRSHVKPPTPRNRGYWVDASDQERSAGEGARPGQYLPRGAGGASPSVGHPEVRKKPSRKRRVLQWAVALAVLAALVSVVILVLTGRTVVPVLSERVFPIHYEEDIARAAQTYGQDPFLIAAVVKAESGYDPEARSRVGAVGLMQLMPDTAAWVVAELSLWQGDEDFDLTDPTENLELGACYLAYLGERFGDGTQLALAAYNAGPGTVTEWIETAGGREKFDLSDIRYPETRHYVERVERYRLLYMRIHPDVFDTTGGSNAVGAFDAGGDALVRWVMTSPREEGRLR